MVQLSLSQSGSQRKESWLNLHGKVILDMVFFQEMCSGLLWTYGCSMESLSEFPHAIENPKCRPMVHTNISPVTLEEQKEFDDFCKSQGKIWNKETLQWEKLRWKPKKGELYFSILLRQVPEIARYSWDGCKLDTNFYEIGNCFKTEEEAITKYEQIKKLLLEV